MAKFSAKPLQWAKRGECIVCISHQVDTAGYPVIRRKGKFGRIGRLMLRRKYGKLGKLVMRHTCDNRNCISPAHIIIGTRTDNMRDMISRGRKRLGRSAKLSLELVEAAKCMRHEGWTNGQIARQFGVCIGTISEAVNGHTWKVMTSA